MIGKNQKEGKGAKPWVERYALASGGAFWNRSKNWIYPKGKRCS
jgi:hypothetical protein